MSSVANFMHFALLLKTKNSLVAERCISYKFFVDIFDFTSTSSRNKQNFVYQSEKIVFVKKNSLIQIPFPLNQRESFFNFKKSVLYKNRLLFGKQLTIGCCFFIFSRYLLMYVFKRIGLIYNRAKMLTGLSQ